MSMESRIMLTFVCLLQLSVYWKPTIDVQNITDSNLYSTDHLYLWKFKPVSIIYGQDLMTRVKSEDSRLKITKAIDNVVSFI